MKPRVLMAHNRYLIRGGEDECVDLQYALLKEKGHEVKIFETSNETIREQGLLKTAQNTIWSIEASKKLEQELEKGQFDILDCHNLFPLLSPSIYYSAKKYHIPVIQTLHNYRLICPNGIFFRDGQVCEECMGKAFPWKGILNKCYRESYSASAVVASMISLHNLLKTWQNKVDLFVTMTEFNKKKYIEAGFPEEKIVVKPHFVYPDPGVGDGTGGYILYVGRLTKEKGILTLLAALEKIGYSIPLKIIGDGPLRERIIDFTNKYRNVEYLGKRDIKEVYDYMGKAHVLVFPSECYETFGRVAIEAFAKGTPVIGADIGAISELIKEGYNGMRFQPGNVEELTVNIKWFFTNPEIVKKMRKNARMEFEQKYTAEENYKMILQIYEIARESSRKDK